MTYAKPLTMLLQALERLPGIGPRSAERIAFYLLRTSREEARQLAQAIVDVKERLRFCTLCFNLSEADRCPVCQDPARDPSIICVVEEPKDVLAIEKTGSFRGLYHVLLGAIAPLEGVGPELLKIDELLHRLSEGTVQEVIVATDADKDGEITAAHLSKLIRGKPIRLTR
ncbi:MAG: recombination protein RecR, partial [Candidatus Omnitrophica bacterium]|nr:recombination protein RecR [Candidatus Omnitrophota bacterium]